MPDPPVLAGGPRGIIIHKETGKCDFISFGSFSMLQADDKDRMDCLKMLKEFRKDKSNLTKIKSKYNLTTKELLQLSKLVQNETFFVSTVKDLVRKLLNKK